MATTVLPIRKIEIRTIERKMRGGSQALLVRDGAGNAFVAKCAGNPQGTRTLINEWIVSRLLKHLRVSTPSVTALHIDRGIPGNDLFEFQLGSRKVPVEPGVHLGSACPVDPDRRAIFDFLPRRLLHRVANLPDLLFSFVFDKWVGQTDSRQAIFIRERPADCNVQFRTYLIDHGQSFGGSRWELSESPLTGLFQDRSIYANPALEAECQAAIARIEKLPEDSFFSIAEEIPPEWLQPGDRENMTRLLELLCGRRTRLNAMIDRALQQLHQTGIIPRTAEAKVLLGSLLLLACLPRSAPPTPAHAGIAMSQTQNVKISRQLKRGRFQLASSFDFVPHTKPEGIGPCGVQIWCSPDGYFFRIYHKKSDQAGNGLLGEYAFLLKQ